MTKREVGSVAVAVAVGVLVALIPTISSAQSNQAPPDKTKTDNGGKFGPVGPEGQKGGKGKGKAVPVRTGATDAGWQGRSSRSLESRRTLATPAGHSICSRGQRTLLKAAQR